MELCALDPATRPATSRHRLEGARLLFRAESHVLQGVLTAMKRYQGTQVSNAQSRMIGASALMLFMQLVCIHLISYTHQTSHPPKPSTTPSTIKGARLFILTAQPPLRLRHAASPTGPNLPSLRLSLVLGDLVLRLLVPVRDHAVEEAARLALGVALLLGLFDFARQMAVGLVVDVLVVLGFVEVGCGGGEVSDGNGESMG